MRRIGEPHGKALAVTCLGVAVGVLALAIASQAREIGRRASGAPSNHRTYLVGSARRFHNVIRLTSSEQGDTAGAMWTAIPQLGAEPFTIALRFRITPRSAPHCFCGADGMALVIQNAPRGRHALGGIGGSIGYAGIRNSVAIELDTWKNPASDFPPPSVGDPSANEISVHAAGPHKSNRANEKYSLGTTTKLPNLSSGTVHTLRVTYAARRLTIGLDGHRSLIRLTLNLSRLVAAKGYGQNAWMGVTAGTGDQTENHDVIGLKRSP